MKYEVKVCRCGRIHIFPSTWREWLEKSSQSRSIVLVCPHCGEVIMMKLQSLDGSFSVHSEPVLNITISGENVVFVDEGIVVHMCSGSTADSYRYGYFCNTREYDYNMVKGISNIQDEEMLGSSWAVVDTQWLIDDVRHKYQSDADDILFSISKQSLKIDWSNTPYRKRFLE